MNPIKIMKRVIKKVTGERNVSYSQSGEDIIIDFILSALGASLPTYVDIGAYDAKKFSNTYLFYKRGATGICVEPNKVLFNKIRKARRNDICLNVGISGSTTGSLEFYVMDTPSLSTFIKKEAKYYQTKGHKIIRKEKVSLMPINDLLNLLTKAIDFLSIDVEGLDFEIIKSINFNKFKPKVVCVETATHVVKSKDMIHSKDKKLIKFMKSKGYFIYADTYMNTIFVDKKSWKNRIE